MTVQVLESARIDLRRGYRFYERQEKGVGGLLPGHFIWRNRFVEPLRGYSFKHPRIQQNASGKFPFAIYYRVESEVAIVYAVLDCRRDPQHIARRLSRP
jgi:hypothetical protein